MPRLHGGFPILEHDLDVLSKIRTHDRGLEVGIAPSRSGGNAVEIKNSRDLEVVCQFQWSVCLNKRYTIDSKPLLAIDHRGRVSEHYCTTRFYQSIMVGALWIGSRSACSQIPADFTREWNYILTSNVVATQNLANRINFRVTSTFSRNLVIFIDIASSFCKFFSLISTR